MALLTRYRVRGIFRRNRRQEIVTMGDFLRRRTGGARRRWRVVGRSESGKVVDRQNPRRWGMRWRGLRRKRYRGRPNPMAGGEPMGPPKKMCLPSDFHNGASRRIDALRRPGKFASSLWASLPGSRRARFSVQFLYVAETVSPPNAPHFGD